MTRWFLSFRPLVDFILSEGILLPCLAIPGILGKNLDKIIQRLDWFQWEEMRNFKLISILTLRNHSVCHSVCYDFIVKKNNSAFWGKSKSGETYAQNHVRLFSHSGHILGNIVCVFVFSRSNLDLKPAFSNILKCLSLFDICFLVKYSENTEETPFDKFYN